MAGYAEWTHLAWSCPPFSLSLSVLLIILSLPASPISTHPRWSSDVCVLLAIMACSGLWTGEDTLEARSLPFFFWFGMRFGRFSLWTGTALWECHSAGTHSVRMPIWQGRQRWAGSDLWLLCSSPRGDRLKNVKGRELWRTHRLLPTGMTICVEIYNIHSKIRLLLQGNCDCAIAK